MIWPFFCCEASLVMSVYTQWFCFSGWLANDSWVRIENQDSGSCISSSLSVGVADWVRCIGLRSANYLQYCVSVLIALIFLFLLRSLWMLFLWITVYVNIFLPLNVFLMPRVLSRHAQTSIFKSEITGANNAQQLSEEAEIEVRIQRITGTGEGISLLHFPEDRWRKWGTTEHAVVSSKLKEGEKQDKQVNEASGKERKVAGCLFSGVTLSPGSVSFKVFFSENKRPKKVLSNKQNGSK